MAFLKDLRIESIVLAQKNSETLLYLPGFSPEPFVVAHNFDERSGEWAFGNYFNDLSEAWEAFENKTIVSSVNLSVDDIFSCFEQYSALNPTHAVNNFLKDAHCVEELAHDLKQAVNEIAAEHIENYLQEHQEMSKAPLYIRYGREVQPKSEQEYLMDINTELLDDDCVMCELPLSGSMGACIIKFTEPVAEALQKKSLTVIYDLDLDDKRERDGFLIEHAYSLAMDEFNKKYGDRFTMNAIAETIDTSPLSYTWIAKKYCQPGISTEELMQSVDGACLRLTQTQRPSFDDVKRPALDAAKRVEEKRALREQIKPGCQLDNVR